MKSTNCKSEILKVNMGLLGVILFRNLFFDIENKDKITLSEFFDGVLKESFQVHIFKQIITF